MQIGSGNISRPKKKMFFFWNKKKTGNKSKSPANQNKRERKIFTNLVYGIIFRPIRKSIESDPSESSHPLPEIQDSNFQQVKSREMDNKFPPD